MTMTHGHMEHEYESVATDISYIDLYWTNRHTWIAINIDIRWGNNNRCTL